MKLTLLGTDGPLPDPDRRASAAVLEVGDARLRFDTGRGLVSPLVGEMRTMPGLPSRPGGERIEIDADGQVVGLF